MKRFILALSLVAICGCATINNRVFHENPTALEPYQCTSEAIAGCTFITVPQIVNPGPLELQWLNIVTIPIGVCCFIVDVPLEFICDTICYPYDKYQTNKKNKAK